VLKLPAIANPRNVIGNGKKHDDGLRQDADDPSGFGGEPGSAFMEDVFESKTVTSGGETFKVSGVLRDNEEIIEDIAPG